LHKQRSEVARHLVVRSGCDGAHTSDGVTAEDRQCGKVEEYRRRLTSASDRHEVRRRRSASGGPFSWQPSSWPIFWPVSSPLFSRPFWARPSSQPSWAPVLQPSWAPPWLVLRLPPELSAQAPAWAPWPEPARRR